MKGFWGRTAFAVVIVCAASARAEENGPPEWPRVFDLPQGQLVVYQPQIESFKDNVLEARSAVMGKRKDSPEEPLFGAMWISARADVNRDTRTVRLTDRKIERIHFPGANLNRVEELKQAVQAKIPRESLTLSLDQLLPMLEAAEKEAAAPAQYKNDPPAIVVVPEPAALVTIDGQPRLEAIPGTSFQRVVNTPFVIAFDPAAKLFYLLAGGAWLTAAQLDWPWGPAAKVPPEIAALADGAPAAEPGAAAPKIVVATRPTELICTDGEPEFTPIPGTGLTYVSNSPNDVFVHLAEGRIYALLSGRWYSAENREGPWAYTPSAQLPADFSRIPADSPMAHVRASVAGTPEASEAVLDTYVPQTAEVRRSTAVLDVAYDGQPQFQPIEGTSMNYAANTSFDVIQLGNKFYCCADAVWYEAASPTGPWSACVDVPDAIYTIPPSSPLYRDTFVEVYDSTPEVVYVGYTPGYTGTYVADDVVVYGTGYPYAAWVGAAYYARPLTWGFAPRYNPVKGVWGARVGWGGSAGWVDPGYGVGRPGAGGWWGAGGYRDASWESTVNTRYGQFTKSGEINRSPGRIEAERTLEGPGGRQISDEAEVQRTLRGVEGERTTTGPGGRQVYQEGEVRRTPGGIEAEKTTTGPGGRQVYDQAEVRRTADGVEGERTVTGPGGAQAERAGEVNRTSDGLAAESRTEGPGGNQVYREGEVERTSDGLHGEQSVSTAGGRYASAETDVQRTSDGFEVNRQAETARGGSAGTTTDVSFDNGEMNVDRSGYVNPAAPPSNVYARGQKSAPAAAEPRAPATPREAPASASDSSGSTLTGSPTASQPARPTTMPAGAPKDLYSDSSGNVYKRSMDGWESNSGGKWTASGGGASSGALQSGTTPGATQTAGARAGQQNAAARTPQERPSAGASTADLNSQYQARARGEQRTQTYQAQTRPSQPAARPSSSASRPSQASRPAPSRSAPSRSGGGGGGRRGR